MEDAVAAGEREAVERPDGGTWFLAAVRLASTRTLLHDASRPVTLWRQRARYALLVGITRAIGRSASSVDPRRCRMIHATPGHCVLMYHEGRAGAVEADIGASRDWLAGAGIRTTLHRAGESVGLESGSWPQFEAAWRFVQRDPAPKDALRTKFSGIAPVSLEDVGAALATARHPFAQQVGPEQRSVVASWERATLPAFLWHMPVDDLLAGAVVPGGLTLARLDVRGFRAQLVGGVNSGRELVARGAGLGRWFLAEAPRHVAGINRGRPAACRVGVLLSVSDDIVLVGSAPVVAAAHRLLARAWVASGVGVLVAGMSSPGSGSTLADLSRAALADLPMRTAGRRAQGEPGRRPTCPGSTPPPRGD
jgi:hypothetical protein